jgi:hypothetical protein
MPQFDRRLAPLGPCFEPEDLRSDIAIFGGIEEIAGDLSVGLGLTEVKLSR